MKDGESQGSQHIKNSKSIIDQGHVCVDDVTDKARVEVIRKY